MTLMEGGLICTWMCILFSLSSVGNEIYTQNFHKKRGKTTQNAHYFKGLTLCTSFIQMAWLTFFLSLAILQVPTKKKLDPSVQTAAAPEVDSMEHTR